MLDINEDEMSGRSVVEFDVEYEKGVHTTGRKKGEMEIVKTTIIHIIPFSFEHSQEIKEYIESYCHRYNLRLNDLRPTPFNGERHGEFICKNCGERSIGFMEKKEFCSEFCKFKKLYN
jgi:hypothetical protein